ncbi:MAG: hypothetical protein L6R40_006652 [Gallowayella cf. fulva]|nr:MAG: hypothetical protein L6R40_006652 [Xanthomendoza cf. fulva]
METNTSDLSNNFQRLTHSDDRSAHTNTLEPQHLQRPTIPHLYGSLTSQYDTVPVSVAALLEQASLYCRVRAFARCHSTLHVIDPDLTQHPVVAYETFLAYWAQWRLADSATVLEDALSSAQQSGKNTETYGIYTLLRIALGRAEIFTKGDFTKARDGMREVRRWLRDVPLDMYTDVQV